MSRFNRFLGKIRLKKMNRWRTELSINRVPVKTRGVNYLNMTKPTDTDSISVYRFCDELNPDSRIRCPNNHNHESGQVLSSVNTAMSSTHTAWEQMKSWGRPVVLGADVWTVHSPVQSRDITSILQPWALITAVAYVTSDRFPLAACRSRPKCAVTNLTSVPFWIHSHTNTALASRESGDALQDREDAERVE